MNYFLTIILSAFITQSALAGGVIRCGSPFNSVYVELPSYGAPTKATVSWGYENISVNDCSESKGNVILCKSTQEVNPSSPSVAHNQLSVQMNGARGVAVFQRAYVPDLYNASTKIEFNDCRRVAQ